MIRHVIAALLAPAVLALGTVHAQEKPFLGKTATQWAADLKKGDAKQRRSAAFALGKLGKNSAPMLGAMKASLRAEKDPKVKDALIFALGEMCRDSDTVRDDLDLEPLFVEATRDVDKHLRRSGMFALGCLAPKSPGTLRAIEMALNDAEPMVRQTAAWAVGRIGLDALHLLPKALGDDDPSVKRDAASAMLSMGDAEKVHEYLKDILPLCADDNAEVRGAALNVLVRIVGPEDKKAIPFLLKSLEDRDVEIRRNSAMALSNIGGPDTVKALPILFEAVKNGDEETRQQAVLAIRNIGPKAAPAVLELVGLLRDDADPKVREYAALALGGIGPDAAGAIPELVKKIQSRTELREVRVKCGIALAQIGPAPGAALAVPGLLAVMTDTSHDPKVRERVMWALRVHKRELASMTGVHDAFVRIIHEPRTADNRMLRYDCAYMLGSVWEQKAPEIALDVLSEYLDDKNIQIVLGVGTTVSGGTDEVKSGQATVKLLRTGDGRILACDALQNIGAARYGARKDILMKLTNLANDKTIYEPLRKQAAELVKAAR